MAVGGGIGLSGISLISPEFGIAASLVILGIVIAAEQRVPILVAMVGVGFFAIFHGYAHGTEMPETAEPVLYALGNRHRSYSYCGGPNWRHLPTL